MEPIPRIDALAVYKGKPARITGLGDKLALQLADGATVRVRPKDIELLHPGPVTALAGLVPPPGDVASAWELLAGTATTLRELAELAYGAWTPAAAWGGWCLLQEDLEFTGTPAAVTVRAADEVEVLRGARAARAAEAAAWAATVARVRAGRPDPADAPHCEEVAQVALGRRKTARLLREFGIADDPLQAHAFLLRIGHWPATLNPYPLRQGLPLDAPALELGALPDEPRRDLTHLDAWAIDDAGNQDPDDALSLDGGRVWVHVADVAALVEPDGPADLEARARGANLYLPEGISPMLPPEVTARLGLGLQAVSPALSFGLDITADGRIAGCEIVPSHVRVTRRTYDEVEAQLGSEPFATLERIAGAYLERRRAQGAVLIEMPEVKLRAAGAEVTITPLAPLRSRTLVREMMLAAGEAAAAHAQRHGLPFPYNTQVGTEWPAPPAGLAAMYACRRTLRRSQVRGAPEPHAGVGLAAYTQVTSPLRRYLDLVAHQQLRRDLRGIEPLPAEAMLERIGAADAVVGQVRATERQSNCHWTLVWLQQRPQWQGTGIVVELRNRRATVLIPELGHETQVAAPGDLALDQTVELRLTGVDLAALEAGFRIER